MKLDEEYCQVSLYIDIDIDINIDIDIDIDIYRSSPEK